MNTSKLLKIKTPVQIIRKIIIISIILSILIWLSADIIINVSYMKTKQRPDSDVGSGLIHHLLFYLENPIEAQNDNITVNKEYIINALTPAKIYIDGRYDCGDFRMQSLMRLQYLYINEINNISPEGAQMLKDIFINAKYWMTEPNEDSICFWSENHQILFAVSEYLAGQAWPDEIFTNDGATGKIHMERARNRINYWMQYRFTYGFTEFNSANYYKMNIAPASNFIQFASPEDSDMVTRMKMCLDLLFYDVASNMYNYTFMAPSGRAYADNMVGETGDGMKIFTDYIWERNEDYKTNTDHMMINFVSMTKAVDGEGKKLYEVPEVIKEIGRDTETKVIKSSTGLNVSELKERDLIGQSDAQIMMQFGMEAYTNPEVIQNTLTYFTKYHMLTNSFFNDFKYINLSILKTFHLLKPMSAILNPMPNGIALQRANIYTYQTEYYQLATAQAYHPGSYGAQQMLSIANFTENAVVFTTHPAQYESADTVDKIPGYWAGFGRAPYSAQYENIRLSIYQLPKKSGFLELYDVPQFTHTYLPEAFFDEIIIDGRYAFGRIGNAYISLTGASDLKYLEYDSDSAVAFENGLEQFQDKKFDLVQYGLNQYWIYELSDSLTETFNEFMTRIKSNNIDFNGEDNLTYFSGGNSLNADFNGVFTVNGVVENMEYKRFDSDYIIAKRESKEFIFDYNDHILRLNFEELDRYAQ